VAWRQVDDQPADLALADRGQLGRDDLEMPVHREGCLRIDLMEAAHGEGAKILPQQRLILDPGQALEHRLIACRR
jgi:hypothetical protein